MVRTTKISQSVVHKRIPLKDAPGESLYRKLVDEGCEDFYNYLDWLDLAKSSNIIILPATGSFFFIPEDMKDTEAVINLKPLNEIKNIKGFFNKIYTFIPDYSYFTGCFVESKNGNKASGDNNYEMQVKNGNINNRIGKERKNSKFWVNIKRIFVSSFKFNLTRKEIAAVLERGGFKLNDITILNNRTFFCAQKISNPETPGN
jgi:hypothetical protein